MNESAIKAKDSFFICRLPAILSLLLILLIFLIVCRPIQNYEDGVYRGTYIDAGPVQMAVEFRLRDGVVEVIEFRHLKRDDTYYLGSEEEPYRSVIKQYLELLDYLKGKNLPGTIGDLYYPENIVQLEVDGYTAATLRSPKIISAVRDALNRGVYSY